MASLPVRRRAGTTPRDVDKGTMGQGMDKEWIVMQCFDASRDAQGNPGEHKEPVPGLDTAMTKEDALKAFHAIEAQRPGEDFSIRRIAPVVQLDHS